jgi:Na+/melibiose symporter-like transporter
MSTYAVRATLRPTAQTTDYRERSTLRGIGIIIALVGVVLAAVALIANIVVANDNPVDRAETTAWTFGLGTTAFMVVKLGIATTLVGILVRLWLRVDSVKAALPDLKSAAESTDGPYGDIDTAYGRATATKRAPRPLIIHRIAERMWLPMLAMGPMVVIAGLVASFVQSGESDPGTFQDLGAWVQGG